MVFGSVEEFIKFIEARLSELKEIEDYLRKKSQDESVDAIDVELQLRVSIDSKELLKIIDDIKEAYSRLLKAIPSGLRGAKWMVVLELINSRPVKVYLVPILSTGLFQGGTQA